MIIVIPPECQKFQARSIPDGIGWSIRPPAKTRSIWQSSTERQGTEKSCLKKVKQRWLSLDMANRQSERRPADGHFESRGQPRASGRIRKVSESQAKTPKFESKEDDQVLTRCGHGQDFRDRCPSLSVTHRGRRQDGKPECTSRVVEDLQSGMKIWKSWRGREPNYFHKGIFNNVKRSM